MGTRLYQSEEYVRALDAYRGAIESGDPALAAPAWYNLGNGLYRQQRFQESAEAYKQALRIDPGEIDYKHNLELALEQQLQQPDQDPQSEDGDESQQDEEQENQDGEQKPGATGPGRTPGRGPGSGPGPGPGAGSRISSPNQRPVR